MENKIIELTKVHRGGLKSYSFSGRPNGEQVRIELDLENKDNDSFTYEIKMPIDTTSFNPSFYLGLLFDSIKKLGGVEELKRKYIFDLTSIDEEFRPFIEENISECERKARNEYINLPSKK